jgi:hypothetical protein
MAHHKRSMKHRKSSRRHSKARRTRARRGGTQLGWRMKQPVPLAGEVVRAANPQSVLDMSAMKQTLPLGEVVRAADLQRGKTYLIQEKRPEHAHLIFKGDFVINNPPDYSHTSIHSHFNNVFNAENKRINDLLLPEKFWNYYEADAH